MTWHDEITVNGVPYPTRNRASFDADGSSEYLADLADSTLQHLVSVHEAAHAVAALVARAYVHSATVTPHTEWGTAVPVRDGVPSGDTISCNFPDGQAFAVFLGAGERAADRWLQQNNLWTPRRALGIELGAYSDRETFLVANPHFGFGADRNDYRVVHDLADAFVIQHWDAITAVAKALATQLCLTGAQVADLARLPNGTHSATCVYDA